MTYQSLGSGAGVNQIKQGMFYDFRVGTSLLFILRAFERIGDHAKQLAVPSFHALTSKERER